MENNELLIALGDMMDQKLAPIKADIASLKEDMAEVKADVAVLKEDVASLKADVDVLKEDVASLKVQVANNTQAIAEMSINMGKLEKRTDRLEVLLEHEIPRSIRLLAEGHGAILEKIVDKRDIDDIKDRVSTTEMVLSIHTKEIEILKMAQ